MTDFFRFPHTPHIAWLASGIPRDDKVLSSTEVTQLLSGEVIVEEKLDGANLGFSVSVDGKVCAQNRGQYLVPPLHGQFARLVPWLAVHEDRLFDALGSNLVVFGEWCAARHSLDYTKLTDWWFLFDVYDRIEGRFWSTVRRDAWALQYGFVVVPRLYAGVVNLTQLHDWVSSVNSRFRLGKLEGLVLRSENADWLEVRAKLVRPDFTQAIEMHWRNRALEWNQLDRTLQNFPTVPYLGAASDKSLKLRQL
jgi:ATP-dependent RNA circularization protein (DNA/RNA ligase family)